MMAKQFEKKPIRRQQGRGLSAVLLSFMTFVVGYLAASWVDVNQLSHWISSSLMSSQVTQDVPKPQAETALAHPKLEFYTLLANDSTPHVAANPKTTDIATNISQQQYKNNQPSEPAKTVNLDKPTLPIKVASAQQEPTHPSLNIEDEPLRPVAKVAKPVGGYSIQVGSFRMLREAQRMKANLVMKGFAADIATVNQQSTYWYRVMIGPFSSMSQAQQVQLAFSRAEHISGMIRKQDV